MAPLSKTIVSVDFIPDPVKSRKHLFSIGSVAGMRSESGTGFPHCCNLEILFKIIINARRNRSVAGGGQVLARVPETRPGRHFARRCAGRWDREAPHSHFSTRRVQSPAFPGGSTSAASFSGCCSLAQSAARVTSTTRTAVVILSQSMFKIIIRCGGGTRVIPVILSKSWRSPGRHRARMPTPATDYCARFHSGRNAG